MWPGSEVPDFDLDGGEAVVESKTYAVSGMTIADQVPQSVCPRRLRLNTVSREGSSRIRSESFPANAIYRIGAFAPDPCAFYHWQTG